MIISIYFNVTDFVPVTASDSKYLRASMPISEKIEVSSCSVHRGLDIISLEPIDCLAFSKKLLEAPLLQSNL
jgi:hypothetical protein